MHIGILINFNNHENLKILKNLDNNKMDFIFTMKLIFYFIIIIAFSILN